MGFAAGLLLRFVILRGVCTVNSRHSDIVFSDNPVTAIFYSPPYFFPTQIAINLSTGISLAYFTNIAIIR